LREEHTLRVFENKVLRKIFGAKRDEVTGEWRKLHNTELHALYSSPDIIRNIKSRRLRWAGHVARMGESRNAYRVLVGRSEGKRPFGRPRRRWEDNIKMDLREVGYDGRDWINLAQDRDQWRAYVRAEMNLRRIGDDDDEDKEGRRGNLVPARSINGAARLNVSIRLTNCHETAAKGNRLTRTAVRLRWVRHVARMGKSRNAYRVLVGRPEVKRPLGRPRRKWEDNIKMDLNEVGYDGRDWINLAQDMDRLRAYVRAAMNLRKPHRIIEHERDSPKVNVFCALSQRKLYGPFFFIEATVTGHSYLDILEQWLVPQSRQDLDDDFIFQQDGAPPHFHNAVRAYLNTEMSDRWLGRAGDSVFVPPLPRDLEELKTRIREAAATVTENMLKRVWEEFDYRLDICRVTRGSHIESL
ncbi:hypothetical protein ANN_16436, partial [Periplaneta americana]